MNLNEELDARIKEAGDIVTSFLPEVSEESGYIAPLTEAVNYAVRSGGKRLRPLIMMEVYRTIAGREADTAVVAPFMAALEMIHCFSLVHDDMPEIDNDTLRRGKSTTWKKYGQDIALLAGDSLLNLAYETALKAYEVQGCDTGRVTGALVYLSRCAGMRGMMGGETADVLAEKQADKTEGTPEMLSYIHEKKTGALLEAAFVIGGILAGASGEEQRLLREAALSIGVAFQIRDDILDEEGDEEKLGKNIGSDRESDKLTWVKLNGMDASKAEAERLCDKAVSALRALPYDTKFLLFLAGFLVNRDY